MPYLNKLFQPVRIHALFETRVYFLGDTIEMVVQVVTRDRLEIIRAKAELLWTPKGQGAAEVRAKMGNGPFVHSSMLFSQRHVIRAGGEEVFSVDLRTENLPPASGLTDAGWKTRVTVESSTRKIYSLESKIKISPHWLARPDGSQEDLRLR
ncbi:MAG: hypothetical protein IH961_03050 [Chloroflexi bacterium]|nr:hypothetical protein [Chloroflexota bacterium]